MVTTGPGLIWVDGAVDAELGALFNEDAGLFAELVFADLGVLFGLEEERAGGELVAADGLGGDDDGA